MAADSLDDITNLDESRVYAVMAYLFVLVVVPWLVRREDPFVNWHIRQGVVVFLVMVLALIGSAWLPVIGGLVVLLLGVADMIALVMALQGRRWKIPLIGLVVDKFKV